MVSIKKLAYKIVLLAALLIFSIVGLNIIYVRNSLPYEYAGGMLIDKHIIAKNTHSPKILIVGGSSGLFGINSDSLENKLHFRVANMSFIAPLGTYFIFNDALKEVKKGDKVFVTMEYDIPHFGKVNAIYSAADYYPEAIKYLNKDENLIDKIRDMFKHKLKNVQNLFWNTLTVNHALNAKVSDVSSVYFRAAFSTKGDIISHLNNLSKTIDFKNFPNDSVDYSKQIEDLNEFSAKSKIKGAEVYFIYPPLAESTYLYGKKAIASIQEQMNQNANCKILGNAEDFIMPDKFFFDSFYHLNAQGRDLRTKKIGDLYTQSK